ARMPANTRSAAGISWAETAGPAFHPVIAARVSNWFAAAAFWLRDSRATSSTPTARSGSVQVRIRMRGSFRPRDMLLLRRLDRVFLQLAVQRGFSHPKQLGRIGAVTAGGLQRIEDGAPLQILDGRQG